MREQAETLKSRQDRAADAITRFAGSMSFAYLHALLFAAWIVVNNGWIPGVKAFDPFPYVMLAMIASVEAIFLSTFILISQNRALALNEKRDELTLQFTLLMEKEVTRLLTLTHSVLRHLQVRIEHVDELEELKQDVPPDQIIAEIEKLQRHDPS